MSALQYLDKKYESLEFPLGFPDHKMNVKLQTYVDKLKRALYQAIAKKSDPTLPGDLAVATSVTGKNMSFKVPLPTNEVCIYYEFGKVKGDGTKLVFPHGRIAHCTNTKYPESTSLKKAQFKPDKKTTVGPLMGIGGAGSSRTEIKLFPDFQTDLQDAGFTVPAAVFVLQAEVKAEEVDENTAKLRFSFPRPGARKIVEQDKSRPVLQVGGVEMIRQTFRKTSHGFNDNDVVALENAPDFTDEPYYVKRIADNLFKLSKTKNDSDFISASSDLSEITVKQIIDWNTLYADETGIQKITEKVPTEHYRSFRKRRWPLIPYEQNWVRITDGDVGYATLHEGKVAEMFVDPNGHFAFKFPNDEYEQVFRFDCELVSPVYARAWMMGTPEQREALKESSESESLGGVPMPITKLLPFFERNSQKASGASEKMTFFLRYGDTEYALTEAFTNPQLLNRVDRKLFRYAQNQRRILEITATDAPGYTLVLHPGDVEGNTIQLDCIVQELEVMWQLYSTEKCPKAPRLTKLNTIKPTIDAGITGKGRNLNMLEELYNAYLHEGFYDILAEEAEFAGLETARNTLLSSRFVPDDAQLDPYRRLSNELLNFGKTIHNVMGDGNCQFRAVAHQLNKLGLGPVTHQKLRSDAVEYLREKNTYRDYEGETDENQEEYLDKMDQDAEWGDAYTLYALANVKDLKIIVVQDDGSKFQIHGGNNCITLGYLRNKHYVSTD